MKRGKNGSSKMKFSRDKNSRVPNIYFQISARFCRKSDSPDSGKKKKIAGRQKKLVWGDFNDSSALIFHPSKTRQKSSEVFVSGQSNDLYLIGSRFHKSFAFWCIH